MTAQQLKASILQLAIQGKLVPQNPEDEPASVLLKKIKAEKDALVKAGKIKKDKHESVIIRNEDGRYLEKKDGKTTDITDEIPFDVPDTWGWCRLKSICSSLIDGDHQPPPQTSSGIPFLVISNVSEGLLSFQKTRFVPQEYYETLSESRIPCFGDVLITVTGSYGIPIYVNTTRQFCFQRHIALLKTIETNNVFLSQWLQAPLVKRYFDEKATGVAQKTLALGVLRDMLLPLPPLEEQKRIVAKIEELLPHVEEYGKAETALSKLNAELPEQLKKSILQWAIQGRLVPQDPTDEPASELLKRIHAEKAALIKSGKLKKEKPLPPISEDEIPFDIPDSWQWVRLGSIITLISGQDFPPSGYNDKQVGIPYITGASNMDNGRLIVNRWTPSPSSIALQGDLLITCKGAGVGKMALMNIPQAHVARQIMAIRPIDGVNVSFVKAFIQSNLPTVRKQMNGLIPGISREVMLQLLFPLPPLAEQKRIVEKLESILDTLNVNKSN